MNIPEGFVVGTKHYGWQSNPIGFRIKSLPPNRNDFSITGSWPGLIVELFWQGSVRVVQSVYRESFEDMTLRDVITGYDFFPEHFSPEEIQKLEVQLKDAKTKARV